MIWINSMKPLMNLVLMINNEDGDVSKLKERLDLSIVYFEL